MTYEAFKDTLLAELSGHFPPDTSISIHSIPRNNCVSVDGLTILESGFNIAPTIYIHEYYQQLKKGTPFSEIYKKIIDDYYRYRPTDNIDPCLFQDFQNIRHQIVFKLIHFERNRDLLKETPHIPFLDLAIVFYCLVASGPSGTATILIQNSHLKLWNTDTNTLYLLAKQNTPFLLSPYFEKMSRLLSDMLPSLSEKEQQLFEDTLFPMYVLTNESRFLGASCILYEELLLDLSRKMNSDFYIIPSSIHEVLLIPATMDMDTTDFNQMIQDVNQTQLDQEEILSDHVYYYSREKNLILPSVSEKVSDF